MTVVPSVTGAPRKRAKPLGKRLKTSGIETKITGLKKAVLKPTSRILRKVLEVWGVLLTSYLRNKTPVGRNRRTICKHSKTTTTTMIIIIIIITTTIIMQSLFISSYTWLTLIVACHYTNIIWWRTGPCVLTTGQARYLCYTLLPDSSSY